MGSFVFSTSTEILILRPGTEGTAAKKRTGSEGYIVAVVDFDPPELPSKNQDLMNLLCWFMRHTNVEVSITQESKIKHPNTEGVGTKN